MSRVRDSLSPPIRGTLRRPVARALTAAGVGGGFDIGSIFPGYDGFWLDFSDQATTYQTNDTSSPVTADGQTIGNIVDKSGSANGHTQVTSGLRPTVVFGELNGKNVARFSNHQLVSPSMFDASYNDAFCYVIVCKDTGTGTMVFGSTAPNFDFYGARQTTAPAKTNWATDNLADSDFRIDQGTGVWTVDLFQWDGTTKVVSSRGLEVSETTTGDLGLVGAHTLGRLAASGTFPFVGDIVEVICINRTFDWFGRARIGKYLYDKYQLPKNYSLIFDGNSLTFGTGSTAGNDYPSVVMNSFPGRVKYNLGVSGQTTPQMTADAATQVDTKRHYAFGVVCAWEITNDIISGSDGPTAYANYVTYCEGRRAAGLKVVAMTVLPRNTTAQAAFDAARAYCNAQILANWPSFADALCDVGNIAELQTPNDGIYYSDAVHLNDAGYALVAAAVVSTLTGLGA